MAVPMKPNAPRHWAAINEVSWVGGMRLLFWICRVFGHWEFRLVLYPVLLWYLATSGSSRRASAAYLRRVGRLVPVPRGLFGVLRHFAAFAENILDKMLLWGGLFDVSQVQYTGIDDMRRRIAAGRGGVLVCSHLGNLDLCRVLSRHHHDVKLCILVHTRHAQAFNRMLEQLDPGSQIDLLQVSELTPATAMLLAEKVEQGAFVVIAGDRIPVAPNPRVALAPFLGQTAAFPVGPYVLASILQCPVLLLFSIRQGAQSHIHFELLRERVTLPRQARAAVLSELVGEYAARLEHHCLSAPLQWFNFFDFWHLPDPDINDASSRH